MLEIWLIQTHLIHNNNLKILTVIVIMRTKQLNLPQNDKGSMIDQILNSVKSLYITRISKMQLVTLLLYSINNSKGSALPSLCCYEKSELIYFTLFLCFGCLEVYWHWHKLWIMFPLYQVTRLCFHFGTIVYARERGLGIQKL